MRGARCWLTLIGLGALMSCAPEVSLAVDLEYASARVPFQTDPRSVLVVESDVDQPYDVLCDLEVVARQRSAFGDAPTRQGAIAALKEQAGRIGAHAVILVSFGEMGMSFWSNQELRGQGRAVRFR